MPNAKQLLKNYEKNKGRVESIELKIGNLVKKGDREAIKVLEKERDIIQEDINLIDTALKHIDKNSKKMILMKHMQNLSWKEIASEFKMTDRSCFNRAKEGLKIMDDMIK